MSKVSSWLGDGRKAKGLSQAEVAAHLGVSQARVSQWETGKAEPPPEIVAKLEKRLGRDARSPAARKAAPAQAVLFAGSEPPPSPKAAARKGNGKTSGAVIGFEEKLWLAADKLRGSLDPAEYKHVVLGLIFLKYISDAFEAKHAALVAEGEDAEDRDQYLAENIFWVPPKTRWSALQKQAKQPEIGVLIDQAMDAIERENSSLRQTLPRDYARPALDKHRLGELIDLLSGVELHEALNRTKDVLGRVYEYFLSKFASAEGRLGGDFYTPQSVVRVMVEMIEPLKGRVFDPCCGSGGMFVQSEKFLDAHGGKAGDISIFGQEFNATTWRLAKMNLAIRGIEANLGNTWADSFRNDLHKALKAEYVLANPPFNVSDWGGDKLREDARWEYGTPPVGNANFAWMQHILRHLSPERGVGAVVMSNGSMSSMQSGEGTIRQKMVEADVVDCMVAMPGQLFYATQIPVCIWVFATNKAAPPFRKRKGEVLFIDARKLGTVVDRVHRELSDEEIARIARTYHAWRGEKGAGTYADKPGFCKAATRDEIASQGYVLTPGRYVGAEAAEEDGEPFEEKMTRLTATLAEQFAAGRRLEKQIMENLGSLGFEL
ncbi:N-6 DNA methylase [Sorangium cellulosum]|uniref:N-6 DNA methylase n=1 Tax=Sorangium cellulosum TaxID=56 RepID=UPI003D9AA9E9